MGTPPWWSGNSPSMPCCSKRRVSVPHRFRVGVGFLRPLCGGAFLKEDERADHFVAPLDLIHEVELELGKVSLRFHQCALPCCARTSPGGRTPAWEGACHAGRGRVPLGEGLSRVVSMVVWRGPSIVTREETHQGETAYIPSAQAHPGVASGRCRASPRQAVSSPED